MDVSNDFLRFARIQDLNRTPAQLAQVVEEMVDFFAPTARQSNIEIKCYVPTALPPVPQRVVRTHPGSCRKTLYVAAHASHIIGMPVADGRLLLMDLMEHATQRQFVHSHTWKQGDLVIWDNRCTMHRARPFDTTKVRDLRRVTTRDVASTLQQAA